MADFEIIDLIPRLISKQKLDDAVRSSRAIICLTPNEHPSGYSYLVIGPSGEFMAKFKSKDYAVIFAAHCI